MWGKGGGVILREDGYLDIEHKAGDLAIKVSMR
jgi:hypothetical protein